MSPIDLWRFWFEEIPSASWFRKDPEMDAALAARFGHLPDLALSGALDGWMEDGLGAVALVLALDQLPRNLRRGRPEAFACDARAREVASAVIRRGLDLERSVHERVFLYLPFEHSESLVDQERALTLFGELGDPMFLDYARRHHAVIARFGRFPHRNAALGRVSTEEEAAFLLTPGSSF